MRLNGPDRYNLTFDSAAFTVRCPNNTSRFSGDAASKNHKLYIVSKDEKIIYVGVTRQPIQNRLRFGWKANGKNGYHGYAWRHHGPEAFLDIWTLNDASIQNPGQFIETIEAEIVFLVRQAGQWPAHQTEIHFHPSEPQHRQIAESIIAHFKLDPAQPA